MFRKFFKSSSKVSSSEGASDGNRQRLNSRSSYASSDDDGSSLSGGGIGICSSPTSATSSNNNNSRSPPPMKAFQVRTKQQEIDANTNKVEELSPFDNCIEASDELALTSQSSGRVDPKTGLADTSLLVSADGEILIIPKELQTANVSSSGNGNEQPTTTTSSLSSNNNRRGRIRKELSFVERTVSQLGEEYKSAVFIGNDLAVAGDKALNGFSTKGWSIPGASLAIKQSSDSMVQLADFVEDLVLTKKSCAAQENQMIDTLRPLVDGQNGLDEVQLHTYQNYIQDSLSTGLKFDVVPSRVGPMSCPGGTIQETVVALENYYSTIAESESRRWRSFASAPGPLVDLRKVKAQTDIRALNRQAALQEMYRRAKSMENHLLACKLDAATKWDAVHTAEENVTKLVEEKLIERSQLRQQQRMDQIKQDEEKRTKDAAHGNLGATKSEIWDIVSEVAASMEEGSFEPMDLPEVLVAGPRDKSHKSEENLPATDSGEFSDSDSAVPMASRHELEEECGLPEFRKEALAADEAVNDAAKSLLKVLENWDITSRSARLAAETCLISACNAQASCLKAIVKSEREFLRERLQMLDDLEDVADNIDVRADIHQYITLDKKTSGGGSYFGDDDDGGVASALAVLNNHIDGNVIDGNRSFNEGGFSEQDMLEPEDLEAGVERLFKNEPLLHDDAPLDDENTTKAREDFEENVLQICKVAKVQSSSAAGRARRSTICYCINAKRNTQPEIISEIQFEGLCRIFSAVLSGCDTSSTSGVSLAKMMLNMSSIFYFKQQSESSEEQHSDNSEEKTKVFIKNELVGHPLWQKDEFWDQVLYQVVTESLTHSGVMTNFQRPSRTAAEKKKSEWGTESNNMKWHDLNEEERYQAASQVHAVVFAQIGALSHSMIEFGCGLEQACAFVRRMSVRNQLPVSQRSMLLEHLIVQREKDTEDDSSPPDQSQAMPAVSTPAE